MRIHLRLSAWLAVTFFGNAISSPLNLTKPTVTLTSGVVVGTTTSLPAATATVNKFLGIPFAASPPERFSPPADSATWATPLDASAYRPTCLQSFNGKLGTEPF